ncbi:MAG: 50S ribosomal protein L21 [Thermoleophilia bacterium]|nr:50S ribosomal protein L21 [Thermoleophilia bacterium]
MSYAIIALGGKQYRVREGQRLLVDRLAADEGSTLEPTVLLVGGDGETQLSPEGVVVTARVVAHVQGDKVRIGKYKPKKGYRRHAGFRAKLSQIEIAEIAARQERRKRTRSKAAEPAEAPETAAETEAPAAAATAEPADAAAPPPSETEEVAPRPARRRTTRKKTEEEVS